MKKCLAPCGGKITEQEYSKIVDEVILFLKGKSAQLLSALQDRMARLSEEMRYEEAASARDQIIMLQKAFESQKVISPDLGDIDVIAFYQEQKTDLLKASSVLFIRNGIMTGSRNFNINEHVSEDIKRSASSFIQTCTQKK
jgi:excinuclease ABC subunit C